MKNNLTQNFALIGIILLATGVFLPVAGLAIPSPLSTVGSPTIRIVDSDGAPIEGANVYLFEGGGGTEVKEAADYSFESDSDGYVSLVGLTGFYRVGVIKNGYESAESTHVPFGEWVNVYSAWGAAGITSNMLYTIRLKYTGANIAEPNGSPTATPTPISTAEPDEMTPTPFGRVGRVFNYVTLSGIGFVVAGLVLNRRRK